MNAYFIFIRDFSSQITRFPHLFEQIQTNDLLLSFVYIFIHSFVLYLQRKQYKKYDFYVCFFCSFYNTYVYTCFYVQFLVALMCVLLLLLCIW